jgi:S-formylglutathione hydrolase FrmB
VRERASRTAPTLCRAALLAVTALTVVASPAGAAVAGDAKITAERQLGARTIELTITTSALAAPTRVQVFLPAGYDADAARRWPVTYYFHGAQGDEKRFAPWYGDLIGSFPSIVVAPASGPLGFYSDWFNGGAGGKPMYETYAIGQLIGLIDARFRTSGDRAGRAAIGESMGGFGVMTFASRHPDVFVTATSMSGFLDSNYPVAGLIVSAGPLAQGGQFDAVFGPRSAQEVRWHGHNPTDLAANLHDVDLQVRTAEGIPNPAVEQLGPGTATDCVVETQIFQTTSSFHRQLLALGKQHAWKDYGPGCHTIPTFHREFADALPGIERVLAQRRADPATFTYRSIEPHFAVWGWQVDADPARALEFLTMRDAGRDGLTLVGSGTTGVTTPVLFRGLKAVDVVAADATRTLTPDHDGRLRFTVDLGAAHRDQQYTAASRDAGERTAGYFTRRGVTFAPHARLVLSRLRIRGAGVRACVRAIGATARGTRVALTDARGRRLARSAAFTATTSTRCVRLVSSRPLRGGRYTVRASGRDGYGHRADSRRAVRR